MVGEGRQEAKNLNRNQQEMSNYFQSFKHKTNWDIDYIQKHGKIIDILSKFKAKSYPLTKSESMSVLLSEWVCVHFYVCVLWIHKGGVYMCEQNEIILLDSTY